MFFNAHPRSFVAGALLFSTALTGITYGVEPKVQDDTEAVQEDIQILADGLQVPAHEVAESIAFQDELGLFMDDLSDRYPNGISRMWFEPAPAQQAFVEFVDQIPNEPPPGVIFLANGHITEEHHFRRAELAHEALDHHGFFNFLTFFDVAADTIRIQMVIEEGAPAPGVGDLLPLIQQQLLLDRELFGAALELQSSDLDLQIDYGKHSVLELDARGGNSMRDGGVFECTSGWSVSGPDGNGIITAAHCRGLDQLVTTGGTVCATVHRSQEFDRGDVEYHTTNCTELAQFSASTTAVRNVRSIRPTRRMRSGNSVCVFGRSSNVRDCTHTIRSRNSRATTLEGDRLRKMVIVNGDSTIGGDSGGGWSFGTVAWGVHSGSNGTISAFTPIRRAERELNVNVLLAP